MCCEPSETVSSDIRRKSKKQRERQSSLPWLSRHPLTSSQAAWTLLSELVPRSASETGGSERRRCSPSLANLESLILACWGHNGCSVSAKDDVSGGIKVLELLRVTAGCVLSGRSHFNMPLAGQGGGRALLLKPVVAMLFFYSFFF